MPRTDLSARKELLIAQADLERIKLGLAWHDVKASVRPAMMPFAAGAARSTASRLIGFALPMIGMGKAGSMVKLLSLGVTAWKLFRTFTHRRR